MTLHPFMFYGALGASVFLITLCQRQVILRYLAFIMLVSWFVCNFLVQRLGFDGAPTVAPSFDALLALTVVWLGRQAHSLTAWDVACLFGVEEGISLAGIAFGQENTRLYYVSLNIVFFAQVVRIGYAAIKGLELARLASGAERLRRSVVRLTRVQ